MAENPQNRRIFSLEEVTKSIQKTLRERYGSAYWVEAEINKLNIYPHSGHAYPELLEKRDGKVVAEMRGLIWKADLSRIQQRFLEIVKEPLKDGIKVLLLCTIQFDPLYGLSLHIQDIDPSYALGQLEREKQACIARLQQEGVWEKNKRCALPLVPKRLAIISVESSKGYSDFVQVILNNPWKFRLEWDLFPALLQGDRSVLSIVGQLEQIERISDQYDVVLIIRGGGGDVGLSSYNQYVLAGAIARFPIPVLTGIGHSTNLTVSEMVAYKSAITPTELADFLLQRFLNFSERLNDASRSISERIPYLLKRQQYDLDQFSNQLHRAAKGVLQKHKDSTTHLAWTVKAGTPRLLQSQKEFLRNEDWKLCTASRIFLKGQAQILENLSKQVAWMDPKNLLEKGYSITLDESGRAVSSTKQVNVGAKLRIQLTDGELISRVEDKLGNE